MLLGQFTINIFIFVTGVFGILYNRTSIIMILMCVELMLLSLNLNFILLSVYFDDLFGQIFALFVLTSAAAESALGLAIIIVYFRIRREISLDEPYLIKN